MHFTVATYKCKGGLSLTSGHRSFLRREFTPQCITLELRGLIPSRNQGWYQLACGSQLLSEYRGTKRIQRDVATASSYVSDGSYDQLVLFIKLFIKWCDKT